MKKVEIITRPERLEDIKDALNKFRFYGLTVSDVLGCGLQKGKTEIYRGKIVTVNILPKIKIEIVIKDDDLEDIISIVTSTARTGQVGDGKIFIYDILDAVRIRTGERGENAI